ncbi:hypothetical protein COLU111180_10515 [Cohnella lubricantis]|uniref:Copper amine oxidase n=1 Tax=Cohnella lubricantis TaxID=2163172 RepID=A0A841TJ18_9BACL|nr:hypothetical protein [Cohnella lubricantis]MBB6678491.1 hypothetical protein [Cohnella lubricantis]MBP2118414.1 hypothetical protein [Cohnella lubricantis]
MRAKLLLQVVLIGTLMTGATAFAEGEKVPVETLKPAVHMDKPELTGTGGALILSDSPESPKTEGAYYRDTVTGQFRVFWHHQNRTGAELNVAVAVTNTSSEPVMLFTEGAGAAVDYSPAVAGQIALEEYMKTDRRRQLAAILQPGDNYYLALQAPDPYTVSGIATFDAVSQHAHLPASVTVTTLGYAGEQPAHPELEPILPGDVHVRGTFPHYDRSGTLQYDTSDGNALIRIDSAASGPWSDALPGEYEEGYNAVDGGTVINNGNYGVLYRLSFVINNEMDENRLISVYENPSGGAGNYVVGWNGKLFETPYLTYNDAWKITDLKVNKRSKIFEGELSLPGGAAGPQVFYFTNSPD